MLRTFDDLGYRQEQRFHLELGLLKLVHMQRLLPLEDLFRQLSLPSGTGSSGSPTPRLAGANSAPRQLETSAPRLNVPIAAGTPGTRQGVREEFKQTVPPLSETASPVTAETHPLQGMFGTASGSASIPAAVFASRPPTMPETSSTRDASVSQSKPEFISASHAETRVALPSTSTAPPIAPTEKTAAEALNPPTETLAPEASPTPPPPDAAIDVEVLRTAVSQALIQGGHETAGYLLEAGNWEWNGNELRVRVGASKTLFEMMYPAQAQQLAREAFRQIAGPGRTVRVEPGDPSLATGKKPRVKPAPIATTESGTRPQDHPLIRHAQQLFSAEIRSVVSLRDPQASKSQVERAPDGHGQN